jgi:hypothetical protein
MNYEPGQVVRYSRPEKGEEALRFHVVQDNGDRVAIRLICDMPIRPIETVAKDEIAPA